MASATYTIEIDLGRDGTYGHLLADITSYVLDAQWNNGMTNGEQEFANPATLRLTLDNSTGAFNPDESGAAYYDLLKKGLLIRVQATFSATTYTLFIGKLREVPRVDVPTYSTLQVQITASDYMLELLDAEFYPELQTNVTTDVALQQVFDSGVVAFPYTGSYWVLGAAGYTELDDTAILLDPAAAYSFDTGRQTLAYVGDASGSANSVRAQQYLRDVVQAELGGRFWFHTRTGKFRFESRHADLNPGASVITLDGDDFEDGRYTTQGLIFNDVTVYYYPRQLGTAASVVFAIDEPIELVKGESKEITARFRDPNNTDAKIAVIDGIHPLRGTDFIANNKADGTGQDFTHKVGVSVKFDAQAATITVTNRRNKLVYFTTLQLRGTPLLTYERRSVNRVEPDSIAAFDRKTETRTIKYLDNEDDARGFAGILAGQYKDPITRFEQVTFIANKTDTRMTQALTRTIGDAITINLSDLGHNKRYIIVGEQHRLTGGGDHTHDCTWILKPIDNVVYWVLEVTGYTELGETTILAL